MSTKWDRRLKKLETVAVDLLKIIVCEREDMEEQNKRTCDPGEECACREMHAAHAARTRGAGIFVMIPRADAGV